MTEPTKLKEELLPPKRSAMNGRNSSSVNNNNGDSSSVNNNNGDNSSSSSSSSRGGIRSRGGRKNTSGQDITKNTPTKKNLKRPPPILRPDMSLTEPPTRSLSLIYDKNTNDWASTITLSTTRFGPLLHSQSCGLVGERSRQLYVENFIREGRKHGIVPREFETLIVERERSERERLLLEKKSQRFGQDVTKVEVKSTVIEQDNLFEMIARELPDDGSLAEDVTTELLTLGDGKDTPTTWTEACEKLEVINAAKKKFTNSDPDPEKLLLAAKKQKKNGASNTKTSRGGGFGIQQPKKRNSPSKSRKSNTFLDVDDDEGDMKLMVDFFSSYGLNPPDIERDDFVDEKVLFRMLKFMDEGYHRQEGDRRTERVKVEALEGSKCWTITSPLFNVGALFMCSRDGLGNGDGGQSLKKAIQATLEQSLDTRKRGVRLYLNGLKILSNVDSILKNNFMNREDDRLSCVGNRGELVEFFQKQQLDFEKNSTLFSMHRFDVPLPSNWCFIEAKFYIETLGQPTKKNAEKAASSIASMCDEKISLLKQLFVTNILTEMLASESGFDLAFKREVLKEGVVDEMFGGYEEEEENAEDDLEVKGEEEDEDDEEEDGEGGEVNFDYEVDEDELEEAEQQQIVESADQLKKSFDLFQKECEMHEKEVFGGGGGGGGEDEKNNDDALHTVPIKSRIYNDYSR